MANNNNAKITLSVGTIALSALASLLIATIAITPQQTRALSTYDNNIWAVFSAKFVSVAFKDISTNSGLAAGELFPILHVSSRSFIRTTHALYSLPAFTVTFGKVATYSTRWLLLRPPPLEFIGTAYGA